MCVVRFPAPIDAGLHKTFQRMFTARKNKKKKKNRRIGNNKKKKKKSKRENRIIFKPKIFFFFFAPSKQLGTENIYTRDLISFISFSAVLKHNMTFLRR